MNPFQTNTMLFVVSLILLLSTCASANSPPSYCFDKGVLNNAPCHALAVCPSHVQPRRCTPGGAKEIQEEQDANKRRQASKIQKNNAKILSAKITNDLNGIMLTPGPRGKLGHIHRCEIAGDARIRELLQDQSDKLWARSKPFVKGAIDKFLNGQSTDSWQFVVDAEKKCREIADSASRIKFVNSIGGEQIQDLFQRECNISDHLEGVAESWLSKAVGELFKTPAGEYVSLLFNKLLKGKWPNTIDFCSLVCRRDRSGVDERRCVIGCAETLSPNCWSQCDLSSCEYGCKEGFWHRKKDRKNCYKRCESKCTLN